ncbi:MAG: ABC transporter ATP-binding protein/permease [Elainellaceae cyanobacterium]
MTRLDLTLFKRFWAIAKPYWWSEEKWAARGSLTLLLVLLLSYTGLSVLLNNKRGALITTLSNRDEPQFWQTVVIFIIVLVAYAPVLAAYVYVRDRFGLQWRRWLTDRFLGEYLGDRAYYTLNASTTDIDNPDQRIAEDIRRFTLDSLKFTLIFLDSFLETIAFGTVLFGISKPLVLFLALYALLGTGVTTLVFGKPLVRLNFQQLKKEADFRFSLIRIRENAEAIAFYRGEDQESRFTRDRFTAVFDNFKRLIRWELGLNGLTNIYEFVPFVIPAIVVAPAIFAGDLEIGKVTEAQGAFIRVFFSLNVVVNQFQDLTNFGAGIDRLASFEDFISQPEAHLVSDTNSDAPVDESTNTPSDASSNTPGDKSEEAEAPKQEADSRVERPAAAEPPAAHNPTITRQQGDRIALQDLTLQTPNYQRTLIEGLSLTLDHGASLLVTGPSGCGKSSLLRAIAGLWSSGKGVIVHPPIEEVLFLPQRPYMVPGSLRDQICYPQPHCELSEDQLSNILAQVNLPDLAQRFNGFDAEETWSEVLSQGEQQRMSFARILSNQPKYVILDEATSALDSNNEAHLYQDLCASGITVLSVGHNESLTRYHNAILALNEKQGWQLLSPGAS